MNSAIETCDLRPNTLVGKRGCRLIRLALSPTSRGHPVISAECSCKRVQGRVTDAFCNLGERNILGSQQIARDCHAPFREVSHGRLAERLEECTREGGAGHVAESCQVVNCPRFAGIFMHGLQGS